MRSTTARSIGDPGNDLAAIFLPAGRVGGGIARRDIDSADAVGDDRPAAGVQLLGRAGAVANQRSGHSYAPPSPPYIF